MPEADHEESEPGGNILVITRLACSLRGREETVFIYPGSLASSAYGRDEAIERFRCNYGVNEEYHDVLFGEDLVITGDDSCGNARIIERPAHQFWLATLFLPQLSSEPDHPHPLIVAFVQAAAAFGKTRGTGD